MGHGEEGRLRISDFETGNPPEGWESAGQLRIFKKKDKDLLGERLSSRDLAVLTNFLILQSTN